jgi:hypothetical protein
MKTRLFIAFLVMAVLAGCDTTVQTGNGDTRIMPNVTGGSGEVLVVMDKFLWDGEAGEKLQDVLKQEFSGLPQSEPLFDVAQITSASFSNVNRFHRSVVLVTIKETGEEAKVRFRQNVWAKPQIVVQIEAPNKQELISLIEDNHNKIQNFLVQYDRQRMTDSYNGSKDLEIQMKVAENHHISLGIPRGYNIDMFTDSYSSVSIEASDFSQVLHIYEYPGTQEDMDSKTILKKRNEFTKKYVKGPNEGSYMTTSMAYPPIFYDLERDGMKIIETRGLWELEGGFMGGPFVSHSVFDSTRNRIVTVEGYVYYPNQKKRVKIRQLEAIVYSLKLL